VDRLKLVDGHYVEVQPTPTPDVAAQLWADPKFADLAKPQTTAQKKFGDYVPTTDKLFKTRIVRYTNEGMGDNIAAKDITEIKKALTVIKWSRSMDPKVAAIADVQAMQDYCGNKRTSDGLSLFASVSVQATASTNYAPGNDALNTKYNVQVDNEMVKEGEADNARVAAGREAASNNAALDRLGDRPYQWTQRYIEQASGVSAWGLIDPKVTYGPDPTTKDGKNCWLIKVSFHAPGDNRMHCAVVYITEEIGPEHVVDCTIDF
jgi:hypothetical protein